MTFIFDRTCHGHWVVSTIASHLCIAYLNPSPSLCTLFLLSTKRYTPCMDIMRVKKYKWWLSTIYKLNDSFWYDFAQSIMAERWRIWVIGLTPNIYVNCPSRSLTCIYSFASKWCLAFLTILSLDYFLQRDFISRSGFCITGTSRLLFFLHPLHICTRVH